LLAKVETTIGTDANPAGAANSVLISSLTLKPLTLQTASRNLMRPYLGASEQIVVGEYAEVEFEVEFAGAGTSAVTIPKWSDLLLACGFAGVVNGTTSYDHSPVSSAFKTVTIYVYVGDGILHKLTGAVGTAVLDLSAGAIPKFKFRFMGYYTAPTDTASSGVVYTGWQTPIGVRDSAVPTLTLHGATKTQVPYRSLKIDLGNNIIYRNLVGATAMLLTDREVTGSVELQYESVSTKAWMPIIQGVTTAALSVQVGSTAFNIATVDAPKVQLLNPSLSDVDGIQHLTMDMRLLPSVGNDELKLATK
jgi:hypothetical protein